MSLQRSIEYLIKIHGAEKVSKEIARVKGEVAGTGKEAEKAAAKNQGLGASMTRAFNGAASSIKSFALSFASIYTVISLFRSLLNHIREVRDMLESLADKAVAAQLPMQKLAMQEGVTLKEATRRAGGTAAVTGATMDIAAEARRAVHSAMGADAVSGGVADVIAGAMARTGGDVTQTGQLAELLARFSATDARQAKDVIAKLEAGMGQTFYNTVGELASAVGGGGLMGIIQGATPEQMVGLLAQARGVGQGKDEAAELMKQVTRAMMDERIQARISEAAGKGFWELPFFERFQYGQQAIGGMSVEELQNIGLPKRQFQQLMTYFMTPEALRARQSAMEAMKGATPETTDRLLREYLQTAPGMSNIMEARSQAEFASLSRFDVTKGLLRKKAKEKLDQLKARGLTGFFDDALSWRESQIDSAMYAAQLESLGVRPAVIPGTQNAEQLLGSQLARELGGRGISLPGGGESRFGFAAPNTSGVVGPQGDWVPAASGFNPPEMGPTSAHQGGTNIYANNVIIPRSDIRYAANNGANIGGGAN